MRRHAEVVSKADVAEVDHVAECDVKAVVLQIVQFLCPLETGEGARYKSRRLIGKRLKG